MAWRPSASAAAWASPWWWKRCNRQSTASVMSGPVRIATNALAAIAAHAHAALPDECCGVLLGTAAAIAEAVSGTNLADDPARRFLLDPETHFNARRRARER